MGAEGKNQVPQSTGEGEIPPESNSGGEESGRLSAVSLLFSCLTLASLHW